MIKTLEKLKTDFCYFVSIFNGSYSSSGNAFDKPLERKMVDYVKDFLNADIKFLDEKYSSIKFFNFKKNISLANYALTQINIFLLSKEEYFSHYVEFKTLTNKIQNRIDIREREYVKWLMEN